jgi:PAS domain S-box-containing protein
MNLTYDLFLLMVNLSQLSSKEKVISLFEEGMQELFKPTTFTFCGEKVDSGNLIFEIQTIHSKFGFINADHAGINDPVHEILIRNSVQMLAVILERLDFHQKLVSERDDLKKSAFINLGELERTVQDLVESRSASINLIEDLSDEIRKRKQAEEEIKASEEKFRNLFENSPVGNSMTSIDGAMNVNKAFELMLGYSEQELRNKHWKDISHPDDIAETEAIVKSLLAGDKNQARFEKRYIHRNGNIVYTDVSTFLQRGKDGNPQFFITTVNDITEIKRSAEMLAYNYHLIRTAGEIAKFGGWDVVISENRSRWSDEVAAIHEMPAGYSPLVSEGIGFYAPDWRGKISEVFTACAEQGISYDEEMQILTSTGKKVWVRTIGYPIRDNAGKIFKIQGFFQNINAQKEAELEIIKLNEELEERVILRTAQLEAANKELEAFSYSVSHDLRAPLRAIHSFTGILKEEYGQLLDEEGRRVCGIIESSSVLMGNLIDDLLAFSRVGRTELLRSDFEVTSLVKSIFIDITSPEERARISFEVSDLALAYGDIATIKQVWANLISNAVKYSSRREKAEIFVGCIPAEEETVYYIKDNGVGFDMQYVHKLFGVFQRLHSSRDFEGNGVGLAIVQRIIHRHDGRVWAEGMVDNGAVFYFSLPNQKKLISGL